MVEPAAVAADHRQPRGAGLHGGVHRQREVGAVLVGGVLAHLDALGAGTCQGRRVDRVQVADDQVDVQAQGGGHPEAGVRGDDHRLLGQVRGDVRRDRVAPGHGHDVRVGAPTGGHHVHLPPLA